MAQLQEAFVNYMNNLFGGYPSEEALTIWKYVEELSHKKFNFAVDATIKNHLYFCALAFSISKKLGFMLSAEKVSRILCRMWLPL